MIGQWLGRYQGDMPGDIIVDIDRVDNEWQGYGLLRPDEARAPIAFARFVTEAVPSIKTTVPVFCLDPRTSKFATWADVAQLFPDFTLPTSVEFSAEVVGDTLKTDWRTPIGSAGSAQITKSKAGDPSQIKPIALSSWAEFKAFVIEASPYEFIFRGHQRNDWRLRTSFHRTGHANLERYNFLALNTVSRHLSGLTSHYFHTADPLQNGAFVTLIQHHGFPTPLLERFSQVPPGRRFGRKLPCPSMHYRRRW
jgi:hypothetical protein